MRTLTAYGIGVVIVLAVFQQHGMAGRKPPAAQYKRVFRWVRPRGARDVYCGFALRISPRRPLIALPV